MRQLLAHIGRCRSSARSLTAGGVMLVALAGCGESDRPSVTEWSERWRQAQAYVPTEQELVEEGSPYCDQLLGRLRSELPDLTPTPSESIDPVVAGWIDHLRTLAFECPSDPGVIRLELSTLDEFATEIGAGLP